MESIIQFITVLIIFIFVLVITYFTTVWIGNYQKVRNKGVNIELLEAQRLNQSQYIQIVRIGERYYALGVSKDSVVSLCEIPKEELELEENTGGSASGSVMPDFKGFLEAARGKMTLGKKD